MLCTYINVRVVRRLRGFWETEPFEEGLQKILQMQSLDEILNETFNFLSGTSTCTEDLLVKNFIEIHVAVADIKK